MQHSFRIFELSESAITLDFGNQINEALNQQVLALAERIETHPFEGFRETLPAYSSLTIFYDLPTVRKAYPHYTSAFAAVKQWIETFLTSFHPSKKIVSSKIVKIPVCYSDTFGLDWTEVCQHTGLSKTEIIERHTAASYRVYMMGFLPGFAYLGGMDERIAVPRRAQPRLQVEAGSVGIAGQQTGVYPLDSPGGWQIIGKTPVRFFNPAAENPVVLQAGDLVQFYTIGEAGFARYRD